MNKKHEIQILGDLLHSKFQKDFPHCMSCVVTDFCHAVNLLLTPTLHELEFGDTYNKSQVPVNRK